MRTPVAASLSWRYALAMLTDIQRTDLVIRGIDRTDRTTWPPGGLMSGVLGLRQADVFAPFTHEGLIGVANELLGAGSWTKFRHDAQALLSFPESGRWEIPHKPWHFDMPARGPTDRFARFMIGGDEIDGVRVRVIEATGEPGDVCLMHPWTLHTTAFSSEDGFLSMSRLPCV